MSEKKRIVLQCEKELDKDRLNEISNKIKENLNKESNLSEEEQKTLLNAIQTIEKEEIIVYDKKINPKTGQKNLMKDILDNNVELIISRDAERFSKIGDNPDVSKIIAEKCSVYTLDNKINTISSDKKLEMRVLNMLNYSCKSSAMKRCMMGQKLHINDVKVWNLDSLTENEIERIQHQIDKKLAKSTKRKRMGFYHKLREEIINNHIEKMNINEINSKLHQKYTNCIITKDIEIMRSREPILIRNGESIRTSLLIKEFFNRNVIICLLEPEEAKFFTVYCIETHSREGLEKYDKKIKKSYSYNEI